MNQKETKLIPLHESDAELIRASQAGNGRVASGDKSLMNAIQVADADGAIHVITKEEIDELQKGAEASLRAVNEHFPAMVKEMPYIARLAVACQVFKALCDHAREGGSFRHLIYNRLGFKNDAYLPLHQCGGTEISNHFKLPEKNEAAEMKEMLDMMGISMEDLLRGKTNEQ